MYIPSAGMQSYTSINSFTFASQSHPATFTSSKNFGFWMNATKPETLPYASKIFDVFCISDASTKINFFPFLTILDCTLQNPECDNYSVNEKYRCKHVRFACVRCVYSASGSVFLVKTELKVQTYTSNTFNYYSIPGTSTDSTFFLILTNLRSTLQVLGCNPTRLELLNCFCFSVATAALSIFEFDNFGTHFTRFEMQPFTSRSF